MEFNLKCDNILKLDDDENVLLTSSLLGEGSKQDATSRLIGVRFPEGGFMPCEDDEDLCDPGSGSGPGGHGVFPESNSLDSKLGVIEVGNDHL